MLDKLNNTVKHWITTAASRELHIAEDSKLYGWIAYGAGMLFINLINTFALFALVWLFRIPLAHVAVFALSYGLLRFVSFGAHADRLLVCTLLSMTYFIGGILLAQHGAIPLPITVISYGFSAVAFFKYAPAETKKRPLDGNLVLFRVLSLLAFLLSLAACIGLRVHHNTIYSNLVLIATLCQSVNLLPITYHLLTERSAP